VAQRRLVIRQPQSRRESANRPIRFHHVSRIRLAGSLRAPHQTTAALWTSHRRHRIPGARRGLHVRHVAAHRGEVPRGHDQLGIRGRENTDAVPSGTPGRSRTPAMVPRFGTTTSSTPTASRTGRRKSTSCARSRAQAQKSFDKARGRK
jgi:hypothetical protein